MGHCHWNGDNDNALLVEGVACMASCAIYAYAKQFSLSVYYSRTISTILHSTCTCIGIFLPFLVSLRWDDRLLLCGEVFAEVVHSWRDRWQQPFCDWRRQISLSRWSRWTRWWLRNFFFLSLSFLECFYQEQMLLSIVVTSLKHSDKRLHNIYPCFQAHITLLSNCIEHYAGAVVSLLLLLLACYNQINSLASVVGWHQILAHKNLVLVRACAYAGTLTTSTWRKCVHVARPLPVSALAHVCSHKPNLRMQISCRRKSRPDGSRNGCYEDVCQSWHWHCQDPSRRNCWIGAKRSCYCK